MIARLVVVVSLVALAACGSEEERELDPAEASAAAERNLGQVVSGVADALAFLNEGGPGCEDDGPCWLPEAEAEIHQIAALLGQRILDERNLERTTSRGGLIYRLRSDVVCGQEEEACRELLDEVELRVRAVSHGPGQVDLLLQVGPDRLRPIELFLHPDRLEVQVDLKELRGALLLLGAEPEELPARMVGRLSFAISQHGVQEFTASFSILEAIALGGGSMDDFEMEMGVALPAVSVHVEGAEGRLTVRWVGLPGSAADALDDDLLPELEEVDAESLERGGCLTVQAAPGGEPITELHADGCD